jgi:O-antigen ligase
VPFSSWKGESAFYFFDYLRTNLVMLFVIAGMAITWKQVKQVMYAIAAGAVVNLFTAGVFQTSGKYGDRLSVITGSIGDPNDFGAHLLLVLPFLLWIALGSRSVLVRIGVVVGLAYGAYLIFRTGSRGALVALVIGCLFYMWKGSTRQRLALIALAPVIAVFLAAMVPKATMTRITSFSENSGGGEAVDSRRSREYLFRTSIRYTLEHPLFGVGAGQFATYEGTHSVMPGMARGSWHATHNTFTEVSSETGIPGLILFVAGIVSTFILLNWTYKHAKRRKDSRDIHVAAFCVMLGFATFCAAVTFLNFAYLFYFPAIAGLSISLWGAAREEFRKRDEAAGLVGHPRPAQAAPFVRPLRRLRPLAPWIY